MKSAGAILKAFGETTTWVIGLLGFFGIASFAVVLNFFKGWVPSLSAYLIAHPFGFGLGVGALAAGALSAVAWIYDTKWGKAARRAKTAAAYERRSAVTQATTRFKAMIETISDWDREAPEEDWDIEDSHRIASYLAEAAAIEAALKRMGLRVHMEPRPPGKLHELDLYRRRFTALRPLLQEELFEAAQLKTEEFEAEARARAHYFPNGQQLLVRNYRP